jgi:anti-sigma factor RsiW
MKCRDVVELMTGYIEGTLSAEDRVRFDEHIAGCDGCRAYLEQMRKTRRLTGTLAAEPIPETLEAELLNAFRNWRGRAGKPTP